MRFMSGFVLGLLFGATIGLVLAPQPGSETRQFLTEQARQRAEQARERLRRQGTERLEEQSDMPGA